MNNKIKRIDEFKNTNEFKTIQDLLDKYMDGATSNEEEATLRKFFEEHGNDIPEEWESYRALFSYIGFEQMNLSQILKEEKEKEIEKEDILEDEEKNIPKKEGGSFSQQMAQIFRHFCGSRRYHRIPDCGHPEDSPASA